MQILITNTSNQQVQIAYRRRPLGALRKKLVFYKVFEDPPKEWSIFSTAFGLAEVNKGSAVYYS